MPSFSFFNIKDFLAGGGWMLIWVGFIASLVYAIDDHKETCDEIKNAVGPKNKWKKRFKLFLLWSLPVISLFAAVSSQLSSEQGDQKLNQATNTIAELKKKMEQVGKEAADADLLNRPITEASAIAEIKLKGEEPVMSPVDKRFSLALLSLCIETNFTYGFSVPSLSASQVSIQSVGIYNGQPAHTFLVEFKSGGSDIGPGSFDFDRHIYITAKETLKRVTQLNIGANFLPHDSEILGGTVRLSINSKILYFDIPRQKAHPEGFGGAGGNGMSFLAFLAK